MEDKTATKEVTPQEIMEAVKGFQEKLDKTGEDSSEFKEFMDKVNPVLEAQEKQNQDLVKELGEERKKREDFENRVNDLEKEIIEKTTKKTIDYKEMDEYKALVEYCKHGSMSMDQEKKQLLRTDDATQGGYLTMPEMDDMIIKQITEISPVRSIARVRSTGSKTLEIPIRTGIPTATYEGEAAEGDDDNSEYGLESVTAYRLTVTVPFTRDMMMDSEFDLENEITGDVAESFAQAEGNGFVNGTGAKQPEGFTSAAAAVTTFASDTGRSITPENLIQLSGELKVGYQPYYGFSRRTLARFRTFSGSDGQFLWQVGLGGGAPNTIAGWPYILLEDMTDWLGDGTGTAGDTPVVFADFMRGYTIIDRTGMEIIRDEVTKKKQAIIELTFHRWNTGQVVLSEAFKLLSLTA